MDHGDIGKAAKEIAVKFLDNPEKYKNKVAHAIRDEGSPSNDASRVHREVRELRKPRDAGRCAGPDANGGRSDPSANGIRHRGYQPH